MTLIEAYEEYVKLLTDEITELAGAAYVHGWRSSRFEKGAELRAKIEELKKPLLIEGKTWEQFCLDFAKLFEQSKISENDN